MDETTHEVEIALRDGLLDELIEQSANGLKIIARLSQMVEDQEASIETWETLNRGLVDTCTTALAQRDKARTLAVLLEQECHSCMDTVHHGNEERY